MSWCEIRKNPKIIIRNKVAMSLRYSNFKGGHSHPCKLTQNHHDCGVSNTLCRSCRDGITGLSCRFAKQAPGTFDESGLFMLHHAGVQPIILYRVEGEREPFIAKGERYTDSFSTRNGVLEAFYSFVPAHGVQ